MLVDQILPRRSGFRALGVFLFKCSGFFLRKVLLEFRVQGFWSLGFRVFGVWLAWFRV